MIRVSSDIRQIKPYVPGKPVEALERELGISGSIKMASNENPLGASSAALKAIRAGLRGIQRYPDGEGYALKDALANKWKVTKTQVILGNGSNEIIELLVRTFIIPGDEAVMAKPTFSLYQKMIQAGHGKSIEVPLKDGCHDLPCMAKAITDRTKLVFICNPNNPTGTIVKKKEVRSFLSDMPEQVLVVFDEAYAEYVSDPNYPHSISFLKEGASLILLRTFSKIYGLAGLRIGYGVSQPEVIGYMNRVRQPFNCNLPGQLGALAALSDETHLARSREVNKKGMAYICDKFKSMGISYLPSEANFIYFYLDKGNSALAGNIHSALLKKGVIIRHLEETYLRVTVGRYNENRRFINELSKVLSTL